MRLLSFLFKRKAKTPPPMPINSENLEAGNWKKGYCKEGGGYWQKTGVRFFIFTGRAQYTDSTYQWREEYPANMEELEKCVINHIG